MDTLQPFLEREVSGISFLQMGLAFLAILGGFTVRAITNFIFRRLIRISERTGTQYDDIIYNAFMKPVGGLAIILGIWLALTILPIPEEPVDVRHFVFEMCKAAIIAMVFWLAIRFVNGFSKRWETRAREDNPHLAGFLPIARKSLVVFLVIFGGLIIVQNLGYSVTSLLAGIGIGGMALAFAAKDTLANIFGSIVIFVDRPFYVGEFVKVGDVMGTVQEVGLRVTRIRTLEDSLITVPNSQLTTQAILNWSRVGKRRVELTVSIAYDTNAEDIDKAVKAIRKIAGEDNRIYETDQQIFLDKFNAYSLDIRIALYFKTGDYTEHLAIKHDLFVKIKAAFEKMEIKFALPFPAIPPDKSMPFVPPQLPTKS